MGIQWILKDLTGKNFGRLTVQRRDPVNDSQNGARWIVRCICGIEKTVRSTHLLNNATVSCGCWNEEKKKLKEFSRDDFLSHMLTRYQKGAQVRGIYWNLTPEQLDELMQGDCFYCGAKPQQRNRQRGSAGAFLYNGIDRLANHLGYFFENCVSCCGTCNIAKQDMSVHAFTSWAARLAENMPNAVSN